MKPRIRRRGLQALPAVLLALGAMTSSGVAATGRDAFIPPTAFRPSSSAGAFVAAARGSWHAPGLGYLFDIARDRVDVYNRSGNLCWRDPLQSGLASLEEQGPISYFARGHGAFDIVFSATPENSFQVHANRIAAIPAACTRALDRSTPLYVFDAIASTLAEFYPFGARRHVDWAERRTRLRPQAAAARSEAELKSVVAELLAGFKDSHTAIRAGDFLFGRPAKSTMDRLFERYQRGEAPTGDVEPAAPSFPAWLSAWQAGQQQRVFDLLDPATRRHGPAGGAVAWGRLAGNVGYLAIEAMDGYEEDATLARQRELMAQTLDLALDDLQSTQALIVDVSNNTGGSGEIAFDIAARFADRRRLVLTLELPGLRARPPQPYHISPTNLQGHARYVRPVYVLTSEATTSAGEWFTLAMRTLPQATLVGQSTQGVFTGDFVKGLPNGWILATSAAICRDAYGVNPEVRGVTPNISLEVYPTSGASTAEFDGGRARAVAALAQAIAE